MLEALLRVVQWKLHMFPAHMNFPSLSLSGLRTKRTAQWRKCNIWEDVANCIGWQRKAQCSKLCSCEGNKLLKCVLHKRVLRMWTGLNCLWIGAIGGLLWTLQLTFCCREYLVHLNNITSRKTLPWNWLRCKPIVNSYSSSDNQMPVYMVVRWDTEIAVRALSWAPVSYLLHPQGKWKHRSASCAWTFAPGVNQLHRVTDRSPLPSTINLEIVESYQCLQSVYVRMVRRLSALTSALHRYAIILCLLAAVVIFMWIF